VLYRYHVQNATAWPERFTYRGYLKAFFTRRLPADRDVKMQLGLLRQAEILQRKLEGLSGEAPAYLHTYVHALRQGGLRRALAVMASGVRPPGIVQSLVFFYRIARGRHIGFIVDEERS
jgi:hypothetical protein